MHHSNFLDLTGQKFYRLTVLHESKKRGSRGQIYWDCRCDCGNLTSTRTERLRKGHCKSCGCLQKQKARIIGKAQRLPNQEKPKRDLFCNYRRSARARRIKFNLSFSDFKILTKQNCYYCGEQPKQIIYHPRHPEDMYIYNGIDRINNNLGYFYLIVFLAVEYVIKPKQLYL